MKEVQDLAAKEDTEYRKALSTRCMHQLQSPLAKPRIENTRLRTIQELQLNGKRYTVYSIKVEICLNRHEDGE
jgi:hypothetical protein